jgi:DNA-binding SARP family transcriptional activator/TolB-like protein
MLVLELLGTLSLRNETPPVPVSAQQKRSLGLLAILALAGREGFPRDRIEAYLWPESSAPLARHSLDQTVYAIRHALGSEFILSSGRELRLNRDLVQVDAWEFEEAIRARQWAAAAERYKGALLEGFHFTDSREAESWIDAERARLLREYQQAVEILANAATEAGDPTRSVTWWRKLANSDPLSASATKQLMRALAAAGDRAGAVKQARLYQKLVRQELEIEPDSEIERLAATLSNDVIAVPSVPAQFAAALVSPLPVETMPDSARLTSVAVLPFVFLSDVENSRALSLGFADALITIFGNLEDVVVAPTSKILNYAAGTEPAQVCRDLGVRHALQGIVQKLGSQWRVSIQLFDAATHKITLSEKHDFKMDSMFEVQDEIGRRVVESLQSRFPSTAPRSRDRYSSDPEAYNDFMAGLRESLPDREETLRSAVAHLSRAVERDPDFALAHATLSTVSMDIYFGFDPQRTWLQRAEDHCRRALALDPALPEGHMARAWILWSPAKGFQHTEAIAALEQVLAARPNFERAHNRMSAICVHIGRLSEARIAHDHSRRANPQTRSGNLEYFYLYSGDFARAEEEAEAWFRERPENMVTLYTRVLPPLLRGDLELAEERLAAAALKHPPGEPLIVSLQGMLHARRGETGPALDCVCRALALPITFGHAHHTYYQVACVHAVLGETDTAMAWLERSVDSGFACWPFFRLDPYLESLREEPAFKRLVADLEVTYSGLNIKRL